MSVKRVLIVDDAKDILFLVTRSVRQLGPDYHVSTAMDGLEALEQIRQTKFDLVITDYMMPGMTGLELAEEVRRHSPDTQVMLMSAYDTSGLRSQVEKMQLSGYLGKPFSVPQIVQTVQRLVTQTQEGEDEQPIESPVLSQVVYEYLKTLHAKTGAYCVVLLNSEGRLMRVVGQVDQNKLARLGMFIAANFLAVTRLTALLDDDDSNFRSIYHEGSKYNIYAYDLNGAFFLAVVFGAAGKAGTVWLYTKETALALIPLLEAGASAGTADDDQDTTVADEFDDLVGDMADNSADPTGFQKL
jgi:CheY-like chemotaxis protein